MTADGKPGYRKPGADTVTPFSQKPTQITLSGVAWSVSCGSSTTLKNVGYKTVSLIGYTGDHFGGATINNSRYAALNTPIDVSSAEEIFLGILTTGAGAGNGSVTATATFELT